MEASVYIPMDRRHAIAHGAELPDRTTGAALFADISGFTPLTDALVRELGPQRGAEELSRQLNLVYDAVIAEIDRYGGSVVEFSGDAITCWLDGDDGRRAVAAALAMQRAMAHFATVTIPSGHTVTLAMKVAVAVGPVRRFLLGDPAAQLVDVLAGATMDLLAALEHLAEKGEVLLDGAAAAGLGRLLQVASWREDQAIGRPVAVVAGLSEPVEPRPWPPLAPDALDDAQLRPWVVPAVYERLQSGRGDLLAELRPAVSLFLRFRGIDYDRDPFAAAKLDGYFRWLHGVVAHYEGTLLQLTIGDKGSYLYVAFGAPVAHEDDTARAASAALELRRPPPALAFLEGVQIGISRGRMRAGGCGGSTCRTYAVMGSEVNLAARLMQAAGPGQILVSHAAQQAAGGAFTWEAPQALPVKGRDEPVTVYELVGSSERPAMRLHEPRYSTPMVGRDAELALIERALDDALAGRGRVVGVSGEAGMGKSRLVAEIVRLASERGLSEYGGECQSYGTRAPYVVWRPIWQVLLGVDPARPPAEQVHAVEQALAAIDPALTPRRPLLSGPLNLPMADNDLTGSFDAKQRKGAAEVLLVDCLRARAGQAPLLLVLEDLHWLDPLSDDLLETIARAIGDLPVLIVLTYRPTAAPLAPASGDTARMGAARLAELPYFEEMRLTDLAPEAIERFVAAKLAQIFGQEVDLAPAHVARLTAKGQGNPFYVEELLNYLRDRGLDPRDPAALERLDLPTSLHSLILSRIDRLGESQKVALKVASIVGRVFRSEWLWGVYPQLGEPARVHADLDALERLDLTPLDTPGPEQTYVFKHVVTQEVAYDSQPFATRSLLHGNLGDFIERRYADAIDQYVDLLAFHYERSANEPKKRQYLRLAGEAAQAAYANSSAIDYFGRLLPLLPDAERVDVMLRLEQVLETVGRWDEASDMCARSLRIAEQLDDRQAQARCRCAMGDLLRKRGAYAEAVTWLESARAGFEAVGDRAGTGQVLHFAGTLSAQQGQYEEARRLYEQSLAIRRELGDQAAIASLLNNLGILARFQSDYDQASALYEESLAIRRALGNRWAVAVSLNNLGLVMRYQGDHDAARRQLEESVAIFRQLGDQWWFANSLSSLADILLDQGDHAAASPLLEESLRINRALGDKRAIAFVLEYWAALAVAQSEPARALRLAGAAAALREAISAPLSAPEQAKLQRRLEPARQALGEAAAAAAWAEGWAQPLDEAIAHALFVGERLPA
jgi:adenylate cyclase